jgi:ubiquinone/menaquinone biosynthesis C-methylase UbiE
MKKILDIGCGTGNLLNYLAKKDKKSYFFGVEIEKETIKRANKNKYCKREEFVLGDAEKLPFKNNFFDEIYCYEVLEHVENLDKVLNEINRVLRKQGKLRITVPLEKSEKILIKYNPDYPKQIGHKRFFSKEEIEKILKKKDFGIKFHKTCNAIEHLYWRHVFKRGGRIINQLGEVDKRASKWMRISSLALSRELGYNIDQTNNKKYKLIMKFFILFVPFVLLLDSIAINKKQKIVCVNEK